MANAVLDLAKAFVTVATEISNTIRFYAELERTIARIPLVGPALVPGGVERANDTNLRAFEEFVRQAEEEIPGFGGLNTYVSSGQAQRDADAFLKLGEEAGRNAASGLEAGVGEGARRASAALRDELRRAMADVQDILTLDISGIEAAARGAARAQLSAIAAEVTAGPDFAEDLAEAIRSTGDEIQRIKTEIALTPTELISSDDLGRLTEAERSLEHLARLWRQVGETKLPELPFAAGGRFPLGAGGGAPSTGFFGGILDALTQDLGRTIEVVSSSILGIARTLQSDFLSLGEKIGSSLSQAISAIGSFLPGIGPAIAGAISNLVSFIGDLFGPSETAKHNQAIRDQINTAIGEMITLDLLAFEGTQSRILELLSGFAISLKDEGLSATTAVQAVTEHTQEIIDLIEQGVRGQELINAVLELVREDLETTEEGLADVADAISNVPEGIKINLRRFNATMAEADRALRIPTFNSGALAQTGLTGTTAAVEPSTSIGINLESGARIVIHADTKEDGEMLVRRLERALMDRQSRGGGGLQAAPYNAPLG